MIRIRPDVQAALSANHPVVALESSVFSQGLPRPHNREGLERMVGAVRRGGAVPAITAVARGTACLGLEPDEIERFLAGSARKISSRDMGFAVAKGVDGATTVAASLVLSRLCGVQVFATGGIGGVHRDAPYDESADLAELARSPLVVVAAGAKSILDIPATCERLESLGIPVIGYRTDEFPGFFTARTGIRLSARADTAAEIVAIYQSHRALGLRQALLVVQPPPAPHALPHERVESAVREAQEDARKKGVAGSDVTPFLLAAVTRLTDGSSLAANLALLEQNSALAAEIATICCAAGNRMDRGGDTIS